MYVLGRNSISTHEILFDDFQILYGYNTGDRKTYLLNYYILVEKFYIYKQKLDKKTYTHILFGLFERKGIGTQSFCYGQQIFKERSS